MITEIVNNAIVILVYGIYLFLPRNLILSRLGTHRNKFLLSYGISISIIIFTITPFLLFDVNLFFWIFTLHLTILILTLPIPFFLSLQHARSNRQFNSRSIGGNHLTIFCCISLVLCFAISFTKNSSIWSAAFVL